MAAAKLIGSVWVFTGKKYRRHSYSFSVKKLVAQFFSSFYPGGTSCFNLQAFASPFTVRTGLLLHTKTGTYTIVAYYTQLYLHITERIQ